MVNKVTEEIGIKEEILDQEISEPLPSEEVVSDEEYQELIEIGAIEETPPINYKTYSRHYTGTNGLRKISKYLFRSYGLSEIGQ